MSNIRKNPCITNSRKWGDVLSEIIHIPLNQRRYEWNDIQVKQFMDDMVHMYNSKYIYSMGKIIIYNDDDGNDYIYDGQQRLITTYLLMCVLFKFNYNDFKIQMRVNRDCEYELHNFHKEILDQGDFESLPKIHCMNQDDMMALVYAFNNGISSMKQHIKNVNNFNCYEDYFIVKGNYECKCGAVYKLHTGFVKHLVKEHNFIRNDKSNIYKAYECIYIYLSEKIKIQNNKQEIYKLMNFIFNETYIDYCKCDNSNYVSYLFEFRNNRGVKVKELDIIKNRILIRIPNEHKQEFYNKWEIWKNKKSENGLKYKDNLFRCAINLLSGNFNNLSLDIKFSSYLKTEKDNLYIKMNKLFKHMEKTELLYNKIFNNNFGALFIQDSKIFHIDWNIFNYVVFPLCVYSGYKQDIIYDIINLHIRKLCINSNLLLNIYDNFKDIIPRCVNNGMGNYYNIFKKKLSEIINEKLKDNELNNIKIKDLKVAKILLLFIELKKQNNGFKIPDNYSVEHIIPQKNNKNIDKKIINNIGNLTLLEFKNSNNGHKGNSSIKNIDYDKKIISYSGSYFKLTNELSTKYKTFNETTIIERGNIITSTIKNYTNIIIS